MTEEGTVTGKVFLVGAGPADVGLLTLKGKEILEQAEVVVCDRLVGEGILSLIPRDAERIDAGKRAGSHTMTQKEINQTLLEKALEGKCVQWNSGDAPGFCIFRTYPDRAQETGPTFAT